MRPRTTKLIGAAILFILGARVAAWLRERSAAAVWQREVAVGRARRKDAAAREFYDYGIG